MTARRRIPAKYQARLLGRVLKRVFRGRPGLLTFIFGSLGFFLVSVWLTNSRLLAAVLGSETYDPATKWRIVMTSLASVSSYFTAQSLVVTVTIALLAGLNLAMLVYLLQHRVTAVRAGSVGFLGLLASLLGLGCFACGSVILTSLLGLTVAGAVVSFLPLHGLEFSLLGIGLLVGQLVCGETYPECAARPDELLRCRLQCMFDSEVCFAPPHCPSDDSDPDMCESLQKLCLTACVES